MIAKKEKNPTNINSLEDFLNFVKNNKANFDESIDISIEFTMKKNENFQGSILLNKGYGSNNLVAMFSDQSIDNKSNLVTGDVVKIKNKKMLPKYVVAIKDVFKDIKSLAKILGPRGSFPSVKNGTLVQTHKEAVVLSNEYASGQRKNYKTDANGYVKFAIGKVSMSLEELDNQIKSIKEYFKNTHSNNAIKSITLSSTMANVSYNI